MTDLSQVGCGVHLLCDLKGLYEFEPGKQEWASQMAALDAAVPDGLVTRYHHAVPGRSQLLGRCGLSWGQRWG